MSTRGTQPAPGALPARSSGADVDLIAALGGEIERVLAPLVPLDAPVALVGAPTHSNVGDSLIWLGQLAYLRNRGAELAYACDRFTYSARALRRRIGARGTVLLSGGGNFGDVWPEQALRERALAETPELRTVQLSQSIHFRRPDSLRRAQGVVNAHRDLHILCRDAQSLELARTSFTAEATLCPDLGLALGPLARPGDGADVDVVLLTRADRERVGEPLTAEPGVSTVVADWSRPERGERRSGVGSRSLDALVAAATPVLRAGAAVLPAERLYEVYCRRRVRAGARVLSQGRVVVTDRLHGHVLALLLGIPHVLVDTGYGKIDGFHAAWTRPSSMAHAAESPDEAARIAGRLLAADAAVGAPLRHDS